MATICLVEKHDERIDSDDDDDDIDNDDDDDDVLCLLFR